MSWGYLKRKNKYNSAGFRLGLSAKNHPAKSCTGQTSFQQGNPVLKATRTNLGESQNPQGEKSATILTIGIVWANYWHTSLVVFLQTINYIKWSTSNYNPWLHQWAQKHPKTLENQGIQQSWMGRLLLKRAVGSTAQPKVFSYLNNQVTSAKAWSCDRLTCRPGPEKPWLTFRAICGIQPFEMLV